MADQSERPEPDHAEDPRKTGVSDQQPEEAPGEQVPRESGARGGSDAGGAPGTSPEEEGRPGQATGNPRAAGG